MRMDTYFLISTCHKIYISHLVKLFFKVHLAYDEDDKPEKF